MNALTTAIYNRSQIASNYKTSIGGRQYSFKAQSAIYPYVVFLILNEKPEFLLGANTITSSNFENIHCIFNIHSNNVGSSNEVGTILENLKTHYDDCTLTISGYNNIVMERTNVLGPYWSEEPPEWVIQVEYKLILQKI